MIGAFAARCLTRRINSGTFVVRISVSVRHGSYLRSLPCNLHCRAHRMMSSLRLRFWFRGSCG